MTIWLGDEMASFGTRECEELQVINMDKEIQRRNINDSLRCGIDVSLKETNLLSQYSVRFIENGYDDLD